MNWNELGAAWSPRLLALLRVVTAILFMEHGAQKLLGFPPSGHPGPELFTLLWFAGVLELVGGFFVLIGWFTRPFALLLAGEMAVAYWMAHRPQVDVTRAERRRRRHTLLLHIPLSRGCRSGGLQPR
jgi:putative oxidoreductase